MNTREYISSSSLKNRILEMANRLDAAIGDNETVLVANLKGSFIFFADLVREIKNRNVMIDFISTESYSGKESTGNIKITRDLSLDVRGKKVILVEDIVDTGLTLSTLIHYIKSVHHAAEVITCVLLDKPSRRKTTITPDFSGFLIEDQFVIGYGLDYDEKYRNLPYIAIVE